MPGGQHVHFLRLRNLQNHERLCLVYGLLGRDVLDEHGSDDFHDMCYVPYQFELTTCKLNGRRLHLQRRVHRS